MTTDDISGCVDCAAAIHSAWVDAAMVLAYDFAEAHYNLQCVNDSNNLHALNTARRALKAHLQGRPASMEGRLKELGEPVGGYVPKPIKPKMGTIRGLFIKHE